MHKQRAFTLVEILVVVTMIAILAGIVTVGYIQYQNKSNDSQAKGLQKLVTSAAERYYSKNLQYPTATTLLGSAPTNNVPTPGQYNTIRTVLDTTLDSLNSGPYKLFVCSGTCTVPNAGGNYVYYLTKGSGAGSAKTYSPTDNPGCVFTFPTSESDGDSYLMMYKTSESTAWQFYRSGNGGITTNDSFWCPLR